MVEVVAINLTRRLVHLSNDRTVPITNLFDECGEETDDIEEAVVIVCGEPGCWLTVAVSSYERETVH